jgi:N-acetylmuramoyl-L-alanine amidase
MRILLLLALATVVSRADEIWLGESMARLGFSNNAPVREGQEERFERNNPRTVVIAERDKDSITINGIRVDIERAVRAKAFKVKGQPDVIRLTIERCDYEKVLVPLLWGPPAGSRKPFRIVIDPGHGGKDSGATNVALNLQEKNLTLDVGKRLAILLRQSGHEVILTRSTDVAVSLSDRSKFANQVKADLFLSLHFNAGPTNKAKGIETYWLTPGGQHSTKDTANAGSTAQLPGNAFDALNINLAFEIQSALIASLGSTDRGTRRARWVVLKDLKCPGVLIESAFLSDVSEARIYTQEAARQRLAQTIAAGVAAYEAKLRR